jgi:hypothetical protein
MRRTRQHHRRMAMHRRLRRAHMAMHRRMHRRHERVMKHNNGRA